MTRPVVCVGAGMLPRVMVARAPPGPDVVITEASSLDRVCRACGWKPKTLLDVSRGTGVLSVVPQHEPIGPIDFS